MTVGRLVYLFYFKPVALVQQSIREGGPVNQIITRWGRRAMRRAALRLSPADEAPASPQQPYEVHVLTGQKFWYQTAFCLRSLIAQARPINIIPVFYDDGTLAEHRQILACIFPNHRFVSKAEVHERLETHLPKGRFPFLRERWENYPNIRKLIDPHLSSSGWKLVLDSDMLFFRRPDFLLDWCARPRRPLHMIDMEESYGYPRPLLERLAGAPIPERLNVGLCGLQSAALDWERIEQWIENLTRSAGTHYYLEQALVAMIVAGQECAVATPDDYHTWPTPEEAAMPNAVMHHYVAESKISYFRYGWKACLRRMIEENSKFIAT